MKATREAAGAPPLDRRAYVPRDLAVAAATWRSLLAQEERSRVMTARLVHDLERLGAPRAVLDDASRVAADEARHVQVCADVLRGLGAEPELPRIELAQLPRLPSGDEAFARAVTQLLVAGFAVAETMSVGGFTAVRAVAREPLARWAYTILARDEVRHGAFGERAGAWAMQAWSVDARSALWPACVAAMESFERRVAGAAHAEPEPSRAAVWQALGAPVAGVTAAGLLASVPRWVLPRLARLGVLPELAPRSQPVT